MIASRSVAIGSMSATAFAASLPGPWAVHCSIQRARGEDLFDAADRAGLERDERIDHHGMAVGRCLVLIDAPHVFEERAAEFVEGDEWGQRRRCQRVDHSALMREERWHCLEPYVAVCCRQAPDAREVPRFHLHGGSLPWTAGGDQLLIRPGHIARGSAGARPTRAERVIG